MENTKYKIVLKNIPKKDFYYYDDFYKSINNIFNGWKTKEGSKKTLLEFLKNAVLNSKEGFKLWDNDLYNYHDINDKIFEIAKNDWQEWFIENNWDEKKHHENCLDNFHWDDIDSAFDEIDGFYKWNTQKCLECQKIGDEYYSQWNDNNWYDEYSASGDFLLGDVSKELLEDFWFEFGIPLYFRFKLI